jgi:Domain of unknown function DUF11
MPRYNPNSIWGSKKKEFHYEPKEDTPPQKRTALPSASGFADEEENPGGWKRGHLIRWAIIIFIAVIVVGAIFLIFLRPAAGPNVGIEFTKPDQVLVGDQFVLMVSPANYSQSILKNATLSVSLPDNVSFVGQSSGQRVMQQTVGDLGPGSVTPQQVNLIVTGDPNSVKHVEVKLTYGTDASPNAQFETDSGVDLVVGGPAISLTVNAPQTVFSGQDFTITVTYTNNTSHSFNGVALALQYPPAFTFTGSSMAPASAGNNSWNIGTIAPAGTGSIMITGNITGPESGTYTLDGTLRGSVEGNTYSLSEGSASLVLGASPLSLSVTLNGTPDYVSQPNDNLTYVITYTNNSSASFQNLVIKATLTGALFDFSSVTTNGSFSSRTDTVTWNAANAPALLNLAPSQSGSVTLNVRTISSYPIRLVSDKNYTLALNVQVSSPTVPPGIAASSTVSAVGVENKIGGAITLASEGFWRDAASGILNSGPYPPKVDQATEYTIHWIITNYATDATNVTVSSSLQSGTTCTGEIKSNVSTAPVCNAANGSVTWTIPFIPATTGITGPPAEAIIQVENTPAVNQVGQAVTLMGPAALSATDAFTSSTLTASARAVTTDLPNDTTIPFGANRRVTQ